MTETGQQPDIYGQVHPEESAELISKKLIEFDAAVEALSAQEKENITKAVEKCPELLTEAFKLQFLRCEVFQEDLAAKRYSNYWDKRVALFGPEKAFQKLTQDEALKDDTAALSNEFFRLVGTKDPSGRNIILGDPSKQDHEAIPTDSMARAIWYVFHAALEDETTQQKGWIILAYPQKARVKQFNRDLMKIITSSIKGCIPVRLSGIHICHPPTFFSIVFPIIKLFFGKRLKKRIRVHSGSVEQVQEGLEKYGLTKDVLPSDLGGDVVLDHTRWLEERREEGK